MLHARLMVFPRAGNSLHSKYAHKPSQVGLKLTQEQTMIPIKSYQKAATWIPGKNPRGTPNSACPEHKEAQGSSRPLQPWGFSPHLHSQLVLPGGSQGTETSSCRGQSPHRLLLSHWQDLPHTRGLSSPKGCTPLEDRRPGGHVLCPGLLAGFCLSANDLRLHPYPIRKSGQTRPVWGRNTSPQTDTTSSTVRKCPRPSEHPSNPHLWPCSLN